MLGEPLGHVLDSVDVDDVVRTELTGERYPVRDVIGREQTARTERPGDGDGEEPDWPASENRDGTARELLRRGREHRVAEGFLEAGRRENLRTVVLPYDGCRDDHVVGEPSVPIDAEDLRPLAHVRLARPAVEAGSARHVALG